MLPQQMLISNPCWHNSSVYWFCIQNKKKKKEKKNESKKQKPGSGKVRMQLAGLEPGSSGAEAKLNRLDRWAIRLNGLDGSILPLSELRGPTRPWGGIKFRVEQVESKLPVAHTSEWDEEGIMRSGYNQKVVNNKLNKYTIKLISTHIPENTSKNQYTSNTFQNHKSDIRRKSVYIKGISKPWIW